jgi:hypothetical protein
MPMGVISVGIVFCPSPTTSFVWATARWLVLELVED